MEGGSCELAAVEMLRQTLASIRLDELPDEARLQLVQTLTRLVLNEVLGIVDAALESSDALVRCEVIEFLGEIWCEEHDQQLLNRLTQDEDWLVRRAAAVSLAQRHVESSRDAIERLLETAGDEEKVGLYYAAYRLTKRSDYFTQFIQGIHHEHYRVQCATSNLLLDMVDDSNRGLVLGLIETRLSQDISEAAREALTGALRSLKNAGDDGLTTSA